MITSLKTQIVVVGSGLAGMITALQCAPNSVILITQGKLGQHTSSALAQGGIAAACWGDDSCDNHEQDTMAAGAGLCDPKVVHDILSMGGDAISLLQQYGVIFDHDGQGNPTLGLEGAHSHRRIFHINGDATGKGIIHALCDAVLKASHITVMSDSLVTQLILVDGEVSGVCVQHGDQPIKISASHVVLATGGIGGLYGDSTNPLSNFGQGIALAANAGATLADLEFVQFHPTALDTPRFPEALISEAVRGEGAILLNEKQERFLKDYKGQELAPRDVIARAITREIQRGGRVYLDATKALGDHFKDRFPSIDALCKEAGINPAQDLIPVKPVEHFHMGGVATNSDGQTSVTGLWAVGECAATGLHGANRLASNSLLEATVMGIRVARSILAQGDKNIKEDRVVKNISPFVFDLSPVQGVMNNLLGIIRYEDGLIKAVQKLLRIIQCSKNHHYPAQVALMISVSAFLRKESIGSHFRTDYPETLPKSQRSFATYQQCLSIAQQFI
ncbi:L-aspartate oxidase [Commensalibacter oyaizuii]|uniref:L-aspartate oxidase n=1 Tax=Commensalibacter oyaizuii TaxID=3043873 RepID=A0ABT6PZT2_9PROT|nr:L-aspartate oxidase [Commensalibacter sp. TBRC 16381]MDI2090360.1 L-aspartate oxidase [Commensalibacter sp. TBRC 16381]